MVTGFSTVALRMMPTVRGNLDTGGQGLTGLCGRTLVVRDHPRRASDSSTVLSAAGSRAWVTSAVASTVFVVER